MRVSRKSEYAVRALVEMALHRDAAGGWRQIPQIAARTGIPEKFLEQILLVLKKGGILQSRRGAVGGYAFQADPSAVTLDQVVALLDGNDPEPPAGDTPTAQAFGRIIHEAGEAGRAVLRGTTITDLADRIRRQTPVGAGMEYQI